MTRTAALAALVLVSPVRAADKDEEAAIDLARMALQKGSPTKAVELATKAIAAYPKSARAYFVRGQAQGQLRKHAEAIKDFDNASALDKKFAIAVNERGAEQFKLGNVKEALADFDAFLKDQPDAFENHWRRGIALYYAGRFADGAKQFKAGEKYYEADVENAFWHFLCLARDAGVDKARKQILPVKADARAYMPPVYDMILGKKKPDDVIAAVEKLGSKGADKVEDLFYAHLYVGLYYEAEGKAAESLDHIKVAVEKYEIGHYMWDVAKVHLSARTKK